MPECKGHCASGTARDGTRYPVVHRTNGRAPRDPATGEFPPAGQWGSWSKCRKCEVFLIWEGKLCPCCSVCLAKSPKSTRTRRAAFAREERRAARHAKDPRCMAKPCVRCGATIPAGHDPRRRYCSDLCRQRGKRHRKYAADPARQNRRCRRCGAPIAAADPTHKIYCSRICNERATDRMRKNRPLADHQAVLQGAVP